MDTKTYVRTYLKSDVQSLKSKIIDLREGGLHKADPTFGKIVDKLDSVTNELDAHAKACLEK